MAVVVFVHLVAADDRMPGTSVLRMKGEKLDLDRRRGACGSRKARLLTSIQVLVEHTCVCISYL